jgi:hypothetical protein
MLFTAQEVCSTTRAQHSRSYRCYSIKKYYTIKRISSCCDAPLLCCRLCCCCCCCCCASLLLPLLLLQSCVRGTGGFVCAEERSEDRSRECSLVLPPSPERCELFELKNDCCGAGRNAGGARGEPFREGSLELLLLLNRELSVDLPVKFCRSLSTSAATCSQM